MNTARPPKTQAEPLATSEKVRVTVPVSPQVLEAFQRLSAAQGVSTGRAMGEWLSDTLEGVEYMADLLVKARTAPKLAVRELHAYATGLTDLTSELIEDLKARSSSRGDRAASPGAARTRRGPAGGGAVAAARKSSETLTPPVSNTGGKVPEKGKKRGSS